MWYDRILQPDYVNKKFPICRFDIQSTYMSTFLSKFDEDNFIFQQNKIKINSEVSIVQVKMGFPLQNPEGPNSTAFVGAECIARSGGFTCPRQAL